MIKVEGDTFYRGCTSKTGMQCNANETGEHCVILHDYYIGKYEITQELWKAIMNNNPSYFQNFYYYSGSSEKQHPVERVSWNEVQEFIEKLNTLTGKKYRLPTEAEWEYAANGGNRRGILSIAEAMTLTLFVGIIIMEITIHMQ
jgi:formylglycine-generating enzyme required for sulfatase activity